MVGQEREPINAVVSERCYHNQLLYEGSVFPITLLYSAPLLEWNWNLTVDHFFQQWSVHWDDPWNHQLSICHHHYQPLHKNVHWTFRLQTGDQWLHDHSLRGQSLIAFCSYLAEEVSFCSRTRHGVMCLPKRQHKKFSSPLASRMWPCYAVF